MNCVIVIPSRFASTRLPGKPLLNRTGKFLVQHVFEQACKSKRASNIIIATDDISIKRACVSFGAPVQMTSLDHASGTDRVAEVASRTEGDIFLNLQGDEPMVSPESIDLLFDLLVNNPDVPMATLATPLKSMEEYQSTSVVKVVRDDLQRALYFSRSPIPHIRDSNPDFNDNIHYLRHIGLYSYRREFLLSLGKIPVHPLEHLEKLEQLRVIGSGFKLLVGITQDPGIGVDTPEDYDAFVAKMAKDACN